MTKKQTKTKTKTKKVNHKKTFVSEKNNLDVPLLGDDDYNEPKNILSSEFSDTVKSSEEVQQSLFDKISETVDATKEVGTSEIPKGNEVEEKIKLDELQGEEQPDSENDSRRIKSTERDQPNSTDSAEKRKAYQRNYQREYQKRKRGGGKTDSAEYTSERTDSKPVAKNVDLIVAAIEGSLMPFIAMKKHKDYEDLKYSVAQKDQMSQLMPPTDFLSQPSWGAYFTAAAMFAMSNFMTAKDDLETRERKKMQADIAKQAGKLETLEKQVELNNSRSAPVI